jgi:hypothetical protein
MIPGTTFAVGDQQDTSCHRRFMKGIIRHKHTRNDPNHQESFTQTSDGLHLPGWRPSFLSEGTFTLRSAKSSFLQALPILERLVEKFEGLGYRFLDTREHFLNLK